jgi:diguanylate cyclase (GGDEF)-like protein
VSDLEKPGWRFGPKILVPMAVATITVIALAGFGLYWAANRGDAVSVERQVRTTQRAIDNVIANLAKEQEIFAVWDEAVVQLRRSHLDRHWLDANFGGVMRDVYGNDDTFILNARDEPVYAVLNGVFVPSRRFEEARPDLQHLIDVVRGRTSEPNGRFQRHPGQARIGADVLTTPRAIHDTTLLNIGGRPAVASAMLIVPFTNAVPRAPGREPILLSVRFLGQAFLRGLETRDLIASPRFSRSADARQGEQTLPLLNEKNQPLVHFMWRPELPGTRIMAVLGPITALLILAMMGAMALLARWLSRSTGELNETMIQLRASEAQAQHLAFHDTLTGLPNRALFSDRLDHAVARARRGEGMTLMLLDLDRFKHVNDTLGHLAGDALIREFGSRVAGLLRSADTVARLGGDEFGILLPGMDRLDDIDAVCRRIHAAVHERFAVRGNSACVGVSIGVIVAPQFGLDRVELMRKADIALYRAKAEGRDCYRHFSEAMDEHIQFRSAIEEDLRAALENGEQLRVHYQPEVGASGRHVLGLEALVRWQHPNRGLIPPEQFVAIAEETGLICQLGEWVLREACKAARRWPDLFIAVNLSPAQFRLSGFADRLIGIVRDEKVDVTQIELEVTEGVLLADDDLVRDALAGLRAAGFRIALDDFGTGYSSFSYLRRFEFDKIKIDRSFVRHLGHRVDSAALVSAVVTIGHAMGLTVTAEGVETGAQKRFLTKVGCHQMQGHLFSRALPEEEVALLLSAQKSEQEAA